jgi:hypothetical protein
MRDADGARVADPQIAHNLSCKTAFQIVDKLWMNFMLPDRNEGSAPSWRLYGRGFLPTMKLQLSQLP